MRIVHTKVVVPSRLGMSLYMSAFEDLMSMKTRAFLVKDIDPAILQRLLGTRSLATELSSEQLENYYSDKAPVPTNAKELQRLMSHGGGLDRQFNNPLYKEKLNNIPHETIRGGSRNCAKLVRSPNWMVPVKMSWTENGSRRTWLRFTARWAALPSLEERK